MSFAPLDSRVCDGKLTTGEIMRQAILARSWAREEGRELTHVVFMGMGEPLANYAHVSEAIERLTDADGFAMSPRRITVSTVGIPQNIRRLASDHPHVNLAVSLHAPGPEAASGTGSGAGRVGRGDS